MPFPMGKWHLLPWGIRGHLLTRSMHLYIQNAYLAKASRLFMYQSGTMPQKWNRELSRKWNDVREMEQGIVPEIERCSKMERGNVREMEQRSRVEQGNVREMEQRNVP